MLPFVVFVNKTILKNYLQENPIFLNEKKREKKIPLSKGFVFIFFSQLDHNFEGVKRNVRYKKASFVYVFLNWTTTLKE